MDESTDTVVGDFLGSQGLSLSHYGIKGMKWGVRKDRGHEGEQVKLKKLPKLDKRWEREYSGLHGFVKLNNKLADHLNGPGGLWGKLNEKPAYKGVNMLLPENKALHQRYMKEANAAMNTAYKRVAAEVGVNPSGTRKLVAKVDKVTKEARFEFADIKHADGEIGGFVAKLNDNGMIIALATLNENGEIAHWGIKGMKWGVRKKKPLPVSADAQSKQGIKDQVKATKIASVSNADLQKAIGRMQLEQNYQRLAHNEKSAVGRWLANTFVDVGKKSAEDYIEKKRSQAVGKLLAGVAVKAATGGVA